MTETVLDPDSAPARTEPGDFPHAHLVLKDEWPIALCGATVREHLGTGAPGRDRCPACLRIAGERGLGRPGWGTI